MSGHRQRHRHTSGRAVSNISKHVVNSYLEANNALLAAMGFSSAGTDASAAAETTTPSPTAEVSFGDETWVMERSTDDYDSLGVGDYVRFSKPIADTDVTAFAQVSGDTNRLHLESDFAEETQFGGRIAHGTLVAGTISAALARFPGVTVYLSQTLEFTGPVRIGGRVTAECEIVEASVATAIGCTRGSSTRPTRRSSTARQSSSSTNCPRRKVGIGSRSPRG